MENRVWLQNICLVNDVNKLIGQARVPWLRGRSSQILSVKAQRRHYRLFSPTNKTIVQFSNPVSCHAPSPAPVPTLRCHRWIFEKPQDDREPWIHIRVRWDEVLNLDSIGYIYTGNRYFFPASFLDRITILQIQTSFILPSISTGHVLQHRTRLFIQDIHLGHCCHQLATQSTSLQPTWTTPGPAFGSADVVALTLQQGANIRQEPVGFPAPKDQHSRATRALTK